MLVEPTKQFHFYLPRKKNERQDSLTSESTQNRRINNKYQREMKISKRKNLSPLSSYQLTIGSEKVRRIGAHGTSSSGVSPVDIVRGTVRPWNSLDLERAFVEENGTIFEAIAL